MSMLRNPMGALTRFDETIPPGWFFEASRACSTRTCADWKARCIGHCGSQNLAVENMLCQKDSNGNCRRICECGPRDAEPGGRVPRA